MQNRHEKTLDLTLLPETVLYWYSLSENNFFHILLALQIVIWTVRPMANF